jgi:hypothetical protein
VDAAKSGGQKVRVGEVFVECAEKTGFPGFGFFRRGDNCALRGEDGSQRGKRNSQDQRMAAGCILIDIREPKWKFRLTSRTPPSTARWLIGRIVATISPDSALEMLD